MTAPVELRAPTLAPSLANRAGFILYVGLDNDDRGGARTSPGDLAEIAETLRDLARDLLPTAETFTALSLAPRPSEPDDVHSLRARLAQAPRFEERSATHDGHSAGTTIDLTGRRVFVDGRPARLTPLEFDLLSHLVRAPHRVVGRAELLRTVWGGAFRPGTRTVDVHVRRLRAKVTGAAIATVRGVGYRFDPSPQIVLSGSGDAR